MTAVRLLVRSDLRRRWRSLLAVALLVGLVGGVVLTVAAGARRTDSSFPRLSRALTTADLSLEVDPRHFEDVAALPMVTAVGPASYMFVAPDGFELGGPMTMAGVDDRFGRVVDRPRLLEGRRPGREPGRGSTAIPVQAVDRPPTFTNLARVDDFPALVGAFLVLTALVTAVHVLVTSVRRRTRDLALLRALGFVGSQLRSTVAWQATTFAVVGLVVGIPAGTVVGRTAWALVARRLGIADHIPLPWTAIALTIPATLLLANLTAALPAHRATRIRPAPTLRTE